MPLSSVFVLLIGLVLGYSRFIEPKVLVVKTHIVQLSKKISAEKIRVALISDTHWGLFNNGISSRELVIKLNSIKPDATFIAGDLLYELEPEKINKVLAPFKDINHRVFAVTGNHDEGHPGPDYEDYLIKGLMEAGITVVNNRSVMLREDVNLIGISDLWAGEYNLSKLNSLKKDQVNLVLTHNPDMAFKIQRNLPVSLIMAGHTHGGQIRIPLVYKKAIPCSYNFDYGLYKNMNSYSVFVTSGIGMVGLPFRFLIPPRIDILEIQ